MKYLSLQRPARTLLKNRAMLDFLLEWLPRTCISAKAQGLDGVHKDSSLGEEKHGKPQRRRGREPARQPKAGIALQEVRLRGLSWRLTIVTR